MNVNECKYVMSSQIRTNYFLVLFQIMMLFILHVSARKMSAYEINNNLCIFIYFYHYNYVPGARNSI
jgi:hypothetical protein